MSYPKSFAYYLSRLSNFSRQRIKLQTIASTTFGPNSQIQIDLPQGLIDLQTFTLQGKARTTAAGVYLPPAELLIDSVSVEVGGVSIQNGFTNYGDLFNIYRQYQMEDKKNFRKVLQLEGKQDTIAAAGEGSDTNNTPMPFAIYNWLGFLGTVKVLDTTLIGPVRITIRLAPSGVLTKHVSSASVPNYELTDVHAKVDILDIADGVYYNMISQKLATSPLEVVYDNYQTVVGSLGQPTQNTRWSTSSDCLEAVIATFKMANPNSFLQGTHKLSEYFKRSGAGVSTSQFKVNGIPYPSIPAEPEDVFVETAHTLGASQDVLGATEADMNEYAKWRALYFVHAHSFTYPDSEDAHRMCGLSGRANQLLGDWQTTGAGDQIQPLLWLKSKSILRIGQGRMVEVVL